MTIINDNFELNYEPARICDGKELLIKYYARDPTDGKMKRVVKRYNHLKNKMNKTDINRFMRKIMNDINVNLAAGKNPFIEAEMPKSYEKLITATDEFLKLKKRDMRPDGHRSYTSYCKKLNEWIVKRDMTDCFVASFTPELAVELMNELSMNEGLNNRTYNNHFVFYRSLWNWLIANYYCKTNVFAKFEKKREDEKFRNVIPAKTHQLIVAYCREFKPELEIVIDLVRAAFIRPSEMCLIQIKEIDLINKVINIPATKAKTHHARFAYLPDWLVDKIKQHYVLERIHPDSYFIASALHPGPVAINTRTMDKYWAKMRKDIGLSMDMQLYSYRDTGINILEENGVARKVIIKLTDHKTEKMLGKYMHQPSKELIENVVSQIKE